MQVNPSKDTEAHARAFLMEPDSAIEAKLIKSISDDLVHAGYLPLDEGAFIEWGCVEHGRIHLYHCEAQAIIDFVPGGFIEDV